MIYCRFAFQWWNYWAYFTSSNWWKWALVGKWLITKSPKDEERRQFCRLYVRMHSKKLIFSYSKWFWLLCQSWRILHLLVFCFIGKTFIIYCIFQAFQSHLHSFQILIYSKFALRIPWVEKFVSVELCTYRSLLKYFLLTFIFTWHYH